MALKNSFDTHTKKIRPNETITFIFLLLQKITHMITIMPNAVKRTPENSKLCVYFQESEAAELFQAFWALKSCIFPLLFF